MSDLVQYINEQQPLFESALTCNEITWGVEKQFAIQALSANDYLFGIAKNNTASLQNSLINIAAIGISLNPVLKHAYLIPRKGKVCLDIGYMGLLHLAQSSGVILWGQSKLVYANDTYTNKGIDKAPSHEFNAFGNRGAVVGGYCTVKTVDGDFLTEEMSIDEIYAIRARSESYKKKSGPWMTDEGEMSRKTIVKRAYKYWPKCERLGTAIQMLNEQGEGFTPEKDITPEFPELISPEQVTTLFSLLCDEDGNYNDIGKKLSRGFKFSNLNEIQVSDYERVLEFAR